MRRADLSPVVSDSEAAAAALPAYPDSDVGSSPRSIGAAAAAAAGGRVPGSFTEELPKWDDAAFTRVKLMCSYGGRILPRPHDNQLRYVGGESRIAVVSRNITFSELTTKLSRMFSSSVIIKYQLPNEDLDALISVTSDEDLENMMEEYDRLQIANAGNRAPASARLRVFLFPSKLERSQTASLSEMMENNNSRERWFVDILNGLPVLSRVRSETSSIVSETPDYTFQGNADALEEWAAAASYGNTSVPPLTAFAEQSTDNKQGNSVSPTALFGSLLQQAGPNEVSSAPGSPSPLKPKSTMMGSSSSAPPAVISLLSAMVDAASKGLPTPASEVEGSMGSFNGKSRLGSGDSSGSIPEQRKHVDSEILLTSEKSILSGSTGGAEQLLPSGLMDDDESSRKYVAKGSFEEVGDGSENVVLDAGLYQVVSESSSRAFKGDESRALSGQPIFDDDLSPTEVLARNLNVLQIDETAPASNTSSASAQLLPPGLAPQQPISAAVVSKFGADEQLKQHPYPVSPRGTGTHLSSEDKSIQQIMPESPSNVISGQRGDVDEGTTRQVSPSLAHFLPSVILPQQPSNVAGEDKFMPQILGANTPREVEATRKVQATSGATSAISPALLPPTVQQQKLPVTPIPSYFYQQAPAHGVEAPMTAATYATQAPGIQLPSTMQIPSPVATVVSNPLPPIAVPLRPANTAVTSRPAAAGVPRPQSPPVVSQHTPSLIGQVRTTSPPSIVPSILTSNVSQSEPLKGHAPMASNVGPVGAATGEAVRTILYQQGEAVNFQRQGSDPVHSQRLAAMNPQVGNQFNAPNLTVPPAPGVPTRFRAMGHPLQQVAEGIPLQQAPLAGIMSDKKVPPPMQRVGTSPSARPPSAPGAQYSYFVVDQSNATPQLAAFGGGPRYTAPSNIPVGVPPTSPDTVPFTGANPFMDNFQTVSTYQDVLEVPPADQKQRRPMR